MTKVYIIYLAICAILNVIFTGAIAIQFYKERSQKVMIQFVSNVIEDGGRFYVKIIYSDKYTDTYTFKTKKVAEAFKQSMMNVRKIEKTR